MDAQTALDYVASHTWLSNTPVVSRHIFLDYDRRYNSTLAVDPVWPVNRRSRRY